MHVLHICGHKRSISSPGIFRPVIYGALSSRSVAHCESDQNTYTIENIGLIILKQPLRGRSSHTRASNRCGDTVTVVSNTFKCPIYKGLTANKVHNTLLACSTDPYL